MSPSRYGLVFHHFGLAARAVEEVRIFLSGLGYRIGPLVVDPEQSVRVAMCAGDGLPAIELVLPSGAEGPLAGILKNRESLLYHACFATKDAEASLAAIARDGLQTILVSPAKPAVLFGGRPVSFHYVSGFGLIELLQ